MKIRIHIEGLQEELEQEVLGMFLRCPHCRLEFPVTDGSVVSDVQKYNAHYNLTHQPMSTAKQ